MELIDTQIAQGDGRGFIPDQEKLTSKLLKCLSC